MRALLILMLVGFALPARAMDVSLLFGVGSDGGTFAPSSDAEAVRPYSNTIYTFAAGLEEDSGRTVFGTRVRLHAKLLFAVQGEDERFGAGVDDTVEAGSNARLMLAVGTTWSIYESDEFDLLLTSSFDYWGTRPYFDGMAINFNGGLRGEYRWDLSFATLRLLAGYDIKPFWLGIDRMEHEFTLRALLGYVGVRATALVGGERLNGVEYERKELGISAEVMF